MKLRTLLSSLLVVILIGNIGLVALAPQSVSAEDLPSTPTVPNAGTLPSGGTGSNVTNSGNSSANVPILSVSNRPGSSSVVKSTAAKFGGCFVGGVLTDAAKALVDKAIKESVKAVADMAKGYLKDFLGGFLSVFGDVPTSDSGAAKANQDNFAALTNKETRNAILTRCASLAIMSNMSSNILSVVRTAGRDGGPTFVKNWTNFQTQAQYRGENIFRAELSTAKLCDYLSTDVKKSFGVDPKTKTPITGQNTRTDSLQPFNLSTQCTMPAGFTQQKYQQDFAGNGGWDTFARMLEPQNNLMGLTALSLQEAQKQRALAEQADINQVIANNGYTGVSGNGKADSCNVMGPAGQCLTFKDIKTTGSYLSQNVGATIGAQFAWLTSAQGLNTIISDATEVMLNRLLDFGNPDEGSAHPANDNGSGYTPTTTNLTIPGGSTPTTPGTPPSPISICIAACVGGGGTTAQCNTACNTPTAPTATTACTANGQAEQAFMLPLLNGGTSPQDVATQTNQKFSLTTGNEAVYYSNNNTIGLPEFYLSGPTSARPVSPTTGVAWDITIRCTH